MGSTELTRGIAEQLTQMGEGIIRRDAHVIESSAAQAKTLLVELGGALTAGREPPDAAALNEMRSGAMRCGAILRRAQLTLQVLQNLHDLFSANETYRVRI